MELAELNERGLVLVGCGHMGGALLKGWLDQGLAPAAVYVIDPRAPDWAAARGVHVNAALPRDPAVMVIAVKPQLMAEVLPDLAPLARSGALVVSVAAGVQMTAYERAFPGSAIVRAMPNTPAAIGQGITAIIGNDRVSAAQMDTAETLLRAAGRVVRLDEERQMDAVTALSGSGPGYVFHMIEAMAAAGEAEGLSPALAMELARATVAGAGAQAMGDESAAALRESVTSQKGTTAAGLEQLMDPETGLGRLMARTIAAAAARSRELGA